MNAPSLRETQRWMASRIRPGRSADSAGGSLLNPQRGTPGSDRLSVYASGYVARMREALAEVYEAVAHVLGQEAFLELARAYAVRYPSHDYNLSLAGRHLPALLAESAVACDLPFLSDLARLEWRVCEAFHASDEPPMDLQHLAALPLEAWAEARVLFQPSVGVIESAWPVLDIWAARQQARDTVNVELSGRPQRILVFRDGVRVRCELLDAAAHRLLEGLLAGRPLGAACDSLAAEGGGPPPPVAEWFARWVRGGLIRRCVFGSGAGAPGS